MSLEFLQNPKKEQDPPPSRVKLEPLGCLITFEVLAIIFAGAVIVKAVF